MTADLIGEILIKTREAAKVLTNLKKIPQHSLNKDNITPLLRQVVCLKLMIPEDTETNLRRLVIISIKKQDLHADNLSEDIIQKQIRKYDCHQTSLVAQKKVLLLMFMERELGITLTDDEAVGVENLDDLSEVILKHMKEGA